MRFLFRAIATGILIGTALFFVPFLFGFLFFGLFVFFIVRMIAGPRRYGRRWGAGYYGHRYFANPYDDYYGNDIVPIDGSRYNASINREAAERHFPVR